MIRNSLSECVLAPSPLGDNRFTFITAVLCRETKCILPSSGPFRSEQFLILTDINKIMYPKKMISVRCVVVVQLERDGTR